MAKPKRGMRRFSVAGKSQTIAAGVFSLILAVPVLLPPAAGATRLPVDLKEVVRAHFPDVQGRLDGSFQTKSTLFLPLKPTTPVPGAVKLELALPNAENPEFLYFSDGWCFVRVVHTGATTTIKLPQLPEKIKKHVMTLKFPSDLLVPDGFVLPISLKPIAGDLTLAMVNETAPVKKPPVVESKPLPALNSNTSAPIDNAIVENRVDVGDGILLVTSPACGKLALLDEKTFKKLDDFTTEGTPCGIAYYNGIAYIADQTKHRILLFDPNKRAFLGQIDLGSKCAPKGILALPKQKLLYVSESATNTVAVLELPSGRVLSRTKVAAGPGRLAVTPNGNYLVVLNVTAGLVTIISTLNQKPVASIIVGASPSFVTITKNSQYAYVTSRGTHHLCVIDIAKKQMVNKIKVGTAPTGLEFNEDESKLYVANAKDNTIWIIDAKTNEKLEEIKLPLDVDFPGEITMLPDGKKLIVASEATDTVGILNLETLKFDEQSQLGFSSDEIRWLPVAAKAN